LVSISDSKEKNKKNKLTKKDKILSPEVKIIEEVEVKILIKKEVIKLKVMNKKNLDISKKFSMNKKVLNSNSINHGILNINLDLRL